MERREEVREFEREGGEAGCCRDFPLLGDRDCRLLASPGEIGAGVTEGNTFCSWTGSSDFVVADIEVLYVNNEVVSKPVIDPNCRVLCYRVERQTLKMCE